MSWKWLCSLEARWTPSIKGAIKIKVCKTGIDRGVIALSFGLYVNDRHQCYIVLHLKIPSSPEYDKKKTVEENIQAENSCLQLLQYFLLLLRAGNEKRKSRHRHHIKRKQWIYFQHHALANLDDLKHTMIKEDCCRRKTYQ